MITLNFRRAVEQVIGRYVANFIAPNTIVQAGGDLTTNGATELTLITQTLTAPPVAGQIHISAHMQPTNSTAAGDLFLLRLYLAGALVASAPISNPAITAYLSHVSLLATAAVSTAGGQIIKLTLQRISGTGTLSSQDLRNGLSWIILPGAGTTA